jgi:calcium-dependent protein kinase
MSQLRAAPPQLPPAPPPAPHTHAAAALRGGRRGSAPRVGALRRRPRGATPCAPTAAAPGPNAARPRLEFGYRRDLSERIELGAVIGAGAYGVVRAGVERATGAPVACKTIPKFLPRLDAALAAGYAAKIHAEVDTHYALGRSLNVVFMHDAYEDDASVHIVMERCTGGTLWHSADLLGAPGGGHGGFSEARCAEVMRAVLRTVAQCHARGVVFRDIKPENYLLASAAPGAPLKLSDFGLAARCRPGQQLTERCGTLSYMAPEVVSQRYGLEADLWSAGVLCYQLLSGRLPFVDEEAEAEGRRGGAPRPKEVFRAILFGRPDLEGPPWELVSPAAKDFVGRLLEKEPRKRLGCADALAHGWVREAGLARAAPLGGTVVARLQRFGTAGALQQAVLRAVARVAAAAPARDADAAAVAALFDGMDTAAAGVLPRAVLSQALGGADGYRLSPEEWAQLLDEMDAERTGSVTRADFVAALLDWRELAATEPRWAEWARTAYDAFGGGDAGIPVGALLEQVCHIDWEQQAAPGAVCRDAVAEALAGVQAEDGRVRLPAWQALLAGAGSDEALGEFDARLSG